MGRSLPCEHGRTRSRCLDCKGVGTCEHVKQRRHCRKCGGADICEHQHGRNQCKQCGTHYKFLKGGFTKDEVKEIGRVMFCQYPNCLVQNRFGTGKALTSDHAHDGNKINTENYRGEVCAGHNLLLAAFDENPAWADYEGQEYRDRRPYSRKE
jgi:hypothetical protein